MTVSGADQHKPQAKCQGAACSAARHPAETGAKPTDLQDENLETIYHGRNSQHQRWRQS